MAAAEDWDWTRPYRTWEATLKKQDDEEDAAPKTKKVKKTVNDWELINDAKALWTRYAMLLFPDRADAVQCTATVHFCCLCTGVAHGVHLTFAMSSWQ